VSRYLRLLYCATFIGIGMGGASAGTGTCTAGPGATVDGGSCCAAFGQTACTCNESGSSASGTVSCSHANIVQGSKKVVTQQVRGMGLQANPTAPPPPAQLQAPTQMQAPTNTRP